MYKMSNNHDDGKLIVVLAVKSLNLCKVLIRIRLQPNGKEDRKRQTGAHRVGLL